MTIRNRLHDLRIRTTAAARAFGQPDLIEPTPYRVLRLGEVGFPDCTAADLRAVARVCEDHGKAGPEIGRWLRDVATAGNGYLKTSGYTLDDLAEMRAELSGLPHDAAREHVCEYQDVRQCAWPGHRKCCDGGPQWGHAWNCPKLP